MTKKKRPTLQDVADRVGVTKMTVSRYLKDPALVSAAAQEKIAEALEVLGYIRNRAPDILSNAKSHAIGVLLPSLTNQVFAEVLRGIEQVTETAGYQTMLAHYGYSAKVEEERIASLLSYNVDGLILSESYHTARTLKMIETAGVPVVEIMDTCSSCIEQAVGIDNIAAARAMVEAMIERGYRHIVYFGARQDVRTLQRQQGYAAAMQLHGLMPRSLLTERSSSYSLGADLLAEALDKYPELDGIFCTNDDLAVGAIFECQRRGIAVPGRIGVAGFHGHDIGQAMVPKLASVITPRKDMGRIAAERLLARLRGEPIHERTVDVGFELKLGESL
ncbi:gluconate operon transcriptional repressor GntR [Zobellella sp. DQSA1]|uniref:gluconate operon transcriptional repressor GntR n=1 Tax=Zobellella sp. DQSA1 TaxID=3342386 RepID=UPI0035C1B725